MVINNSSHATTKFRLYVNGFDDITVRISTAVRALVFLNLIYNNSRSQLLSPASQTSLHGALHRIEFRFSNLLADQHSTAEVRRMTNISKSCPIYDKFLTNIPQSESSYHDKLLKVKTGKDAMLLLLININLQNVEVTPEFHCSMLPSKPSYYWNATDIQSLITHYR